MHPVFANISAPAINITADIVINGESCTSKEGNSNYKNWKADPLSGWVYGTSAPSRSVTIRGGYHATAPNSSAILVTAVDGLTVDGLYMASSDDGGISLIETAPLPSLSQVKNVHMRANSQYCATWNNMMKCQNPGDTGAQAVALVSLIECVRCRLQLFSEPKPRQ